MINVRHRLLLAGLLAGAAFTVSAQTPVAPCAGAGPCAAGANRAERMEVMRERMQQRHAERLAALKTKLQLTAEQENAWSAFAASCQPQLLGSPAWQMDRNAIAKMSTPERLDLMQSRMAERQTAFTKHADAVRAFYGQLTPAQQKTFDTEMPNMMLFQGRGGAGQKPGGAGRPGPRNWSN